MNEIVVLDKYTTEFKALAKRTAEDMVQMARIAHEVHELVGYDGYIRWITDDLGISARTGAHLLNVYKLTLTANFAVNQLAPSALTLLAAPSTPEPARQEVIAKAATNKVTHKETKAIIEKHKPKIEVPAPIQGFISPGDSPIYSVIEQLGQIQTLSPRERFDLVKALREMAGRIRWITFSVQQ
jgi:hypothetical protein